MCQKKTGSQIDNYTSTPTHTVVIMFGDQGWLHLPVVLLSEQWYNQRSFASIVGGVCVHLVCTWMCVYVSVHTFDPQCAVFNKIMMAGPVYVSSTEQR